MNQTDYIALFAIVLLVLIGLANASKKRDKLPDQIDQGLEDEPIGESYLPDKSEGSMTSQRDKMRELFRKYGHNEQKSVFAYAAAERAGQVARQSNDYKLDAEEYARRLFSDGIRKGWLK